MIYFSAGLLLVAVLLAVLHLRSSRGKSVSTVLTALVAVLAVVVGAATVVQVYRIGDSGAKATWSDIPLTAPSSEKPAKNPGSSTPTPTVTCSLPGGFVAPGWQPTAERPTRTRSSIGACDSPMPKP